MRKSDIRIEQEVISILLNEPDCVTWVNINPKWFLNFNLRHVFQAIKNNPYSFWPLFYDKAKKEGYTGSYKQLNNIVNGYSYNGDIKKYAKALHHSYLCFKYQKALKYWQLNPNDEDNITKLNNIVNAIHRFGVIDNGSIKDTLNYILEGLKAPRPTGIKTYSNLNSIIGGGLYPGMLFTIGARTGVGKTAFALNLTKKIEINNPKIEVNYFSMEMTKEEIVDRFISMLTHINSLELRNPYSLTKNQKRKVKRAIKKLECSNLKIFDKLHSLKSILSMIKDRVNQHIKSCHYVAIIDYIGLIKVDDTYKDRYLQIGQITGSLKRLANDYSFPIIILTQLNRMAESDSKPSLSDIRESGSIEQDSNVVGLLWHNKKVTNIHKPKRFMELSIQKNRSGMVADLDYLFNPNHMTFKELNESDNDDKYSNYF